MRERRRGGEEEKSHQPHRPPLIKPPSPGGGAFEARPTPSHPRNHHRCPPFPPPPPLYLLPSPSHAPLAAATSPSSSPSSFRPQVNRGCLHRRRISSSRSSRRREISGCPRHGRRLRPRAAAGGRTLPGAHARWPPPRLPPIRAAGGAATAAAPVLRVHSRRWRGVRRGLQAPPPQVTPVPLPIYEPHSRNGRALVTRLRKLGCDFSSLLSCRRCDFRVIRILYTGCATTVYFCGNGVIVTGYTYFGFPCFSCQG